MGRGRNPIVREIIHHTPASFSPNVQRKDTVVWTLTATGSYSVQSVTCGLGKTVKVVWFKHEVLRWSVIQWMIMLRRLSWIASVEGCL